MTTTFAPPAGYAGPRRSLVLSGGGMRLSYQAGVLRALQEEGLVFSHVDATSGGAMNAAMLLSGLTPQQMCDRWRTLDMKRTISLMPLHSYLSQRDAVAMGSADAFIRYAYPHLGIDLAKVRAQKDVQGTFNVFNYSRKVTEVVPHQQLDTDYLVAGMSLPGVMPPVRKNGALYLDTAFVRDANPLEAARRGAEEIWLVWCLGNTDEYRGGLLHIYIQMLEMAANGNLNRDLEQLAELNARIAKGDSPYGQTAPIELHVIRPEVPLPLDPDLYMGKVTAGTLIDMGYADARRYLGHRPEAGLPLTPETIIMSNGAPGITFRETMRGGFSLGATDPVEGAAAGAKSGSELAMHATVTVRDVDRFIADPNHNGSIVGHIDFTPFGTGIEAGEGVFRLFSPASDPRMKLMVYELPFHHQGEDYYMAGHKEVRDDPGFDLWKDTTTLLTKLHKGKDATGPVVGAGVLTLGVADFTKLLAGIRVIDADDAATSAKTIAKFGSFFAGELWKSYAPFAR